MSVQIKTRTNDGKFCDCTPRDFADAALNKIAEHGWRWLQMQLCLLRAEDSKHSDMEADVWIERYRALRGIK